MTFDPAGDPDFPFSDFETDAAAYAKSHSFWQVGFERAVGDRRSAWRDWMPDPFRDGHPIFSVIDPGKRRGVLLQQVRRTDDPVWFKCWVSEVAGTGSDGRLPYLFMETFVSNDGRHLFEMLVQGWCAQDIDEHAMSEFTARIGREVAGGERADSPSR